MKRYLLIAKRDENDPVAVSAVLQFSSKDGSSTDVVYINVEHAGQIAPGLKQLNEKLKKRIIVTSDEGRELVEKLARLSNDKKHRLHVENRFIRFVGGLLGIRDWLRGGLCMLVQE